MKIASASSLFTSALLASSVFVTAEEQNISLEAGWNLIAVQVVQPNDPTPADGVVKPAEAFSTFNGIKSIWSFDNESKSWRTWHAGDSPETQLRNQLPNVALNSIEFGRAYWVESAIRGELVLKGEIPDTTPEVSLHEGWNLVGIPIAGPAGFKDIPDNLPIISVINQPKLDYETLVSWQSQAPFIPGYLVNRFGFNDGGVDDFSNFNPSKAYWIKIEPPANGVAIPPIKPQLNYILRADADVQPEGNYPNGREDLVISDSATPLAAEEQTHIAFLENEDIQILSFSNDGGGIMSWKVAWNPEDTTDEPWITLSSEASAAGNVQELSGITALGTEIIYLRLDRKNLVQGTHRGILTLTTSSETKEFQVTAYVGRLKGEWHGFAEIDAVNGKRNPVPDIDLNISFFEDPKTTGLLRGAINSRRVPLFPVDVQLAGYITQSSGNQFFLSGSYVLPPGDKNFEPIDVLNEADIDWNNDGLNGADLINEFPFPIYRSVFLQGELIFANAIDDEGYQITGSYREVIYGMMRDPIELVGRFTLTRESPTPFDSFNTLEVSPLPGSVSSITTSPPTFDSPIANETAAQTVDLQIDTKFVLNDFRLSFSLSSLDNSNFTIRLIAPSSDDGEERPSIILHDGSPINIEEFQNAIYPTGLTPLSGEVSIQSFLASVENTQGQWTIEVINNTGGAFTLRSPQLQLVGQPIVDLHGQIIDTNGNGISGASVSVLGLPFSQQLNGLTNSEGHFEILGLPAMPINLSASRLGYEGGGSIIPSQLLPSFQGNTTIEQKFAARFVPFPAVPPGQLNVPGFSETGSSAETPFKVELILEEGPPRITALPNQGIASLEVSFAALGTEGPVTWDFGDGSPISSLGATKHIYDLPGIYTAILTHSGGTIEQEIIVMPSPGKTRLSAQQTPGTGSKYAAAGNYATFIFAPRFSGGGSLPVAITSTIDPQPTPQDYPTAAPIADLVMMQHTYASSADIDLAPHTNEPGSPFESDLFTSGTVNYWGSPLNKQPVSGTGLPRLVPENTMLGNPATNDPGWNYEDHNYLLWPQKWYLDGDENGLFNNGDIDLAEGSSVLVNDDTFNSPPSTEWLTDQSLDIKHFKMTCNFGALISPAGFNPASVRSLTVAPILAAPLKTPPAGAGLGQNLYFQLSTNTLVLPVSVTP